MWPTGTWRDDHGQMAFLAAVLMMFVIVVGGLVVDYGLVYLQAAHFRNAVDAAALAGANERQLNPAGGTDTAQAAVLSYLALHGYVPDSRTSISVSFPPPPPGSKQQTVRVQATRTSPTKFMRLVGVGSVTFGQETAAEVGGNAVDVVLSMDITNSMAPQMSEMRVAVRGFLDQLNPRTSDPNGPQVALTVFNGMNLPRSRPLTPGGRVVQVATHLTQDYQLLTKIADNTGSAACPSAWPSPQPFFADTTRIIADRICPLQANGGSGTYVGNGFEIALQPASSWNMWAASNGGRPNAKKVLVLITDGTNNAAPIPVSDLDADTVAAANAVKAGWDGVMGTNDDVEVFTIGFFNTAEDASAFATNPPLCPAPIVPPGASSNDSELIAASSSTPGSCDHYYALNKSQATQLPALFTTIATRILRGRLSQ